LEHFGQVHAYQVQRIPVSSDFRQISLKGDHGKGEKLFSASVSAFCSLTRPTRRNAAQLDDLTLPLYDQVSPEALRFAAAALSECRRAPMGLLRRLASEPVEIAAPVLMRSVALTDIDLVGIIARMGLPHARAIAGRPELNPSIARLIHALEAASPALKPSMPDAPPIPEKNGVAATAIAPHPRPGSAAEAARGKLRAMMAVGGGHQARESKHKTGATDHYPRLRETVLTGVPALFRTALADAADVGLAQSDDVLRSGPKSLSLVLRGLAMSAEQAFLIVAAAHPSAFAHPEAIRLFLEHFGATTMETGRDEIRRLRGESVAMVVLNPPPAPTGALPRDRTYALKAS
jgi:uncharacterized protein (DUF2336 family)